MPYPPQGGALQRSYHLLRHACQRHVVHLVALNQRTVLPTDDSVRDAIDHLSKFCASVTVFEMPAAASDARQAITAAVSFFRSLPYEVNWLRSARMHAHLRELAANESFDLLHVDTIGLMPYAEWFNDVPIILNHHNVESHLVQRRAAGEMSVSRRLFFNREASKIEKLERELCGRAVVNLTVSELDAVRLRGIVPSARTMEVDNGVDVHYFRPGVSGRRQEGGLIFAGSLSLYANREAAQYLVDDIWPALLADHPHRRLTIVGRNPPPELIRAGRDPRLSVVGWVEDVRPYLDAAAIYVCPIRNGGGTRLKVLDALAMGKPLVATELAVEGLALQEEEHYLRAETPTEYVQQIRRLENDSALCERLTNAGRELVVRRYAWDVIGEKLDRAYAQYARRAMAAGMASA
ncbi:MAG: glycosyltransferase [Gemmatimonadetes bacterium]|nr:glycosyltransferase [Gemmatimonadota bacterium]